MTALIACSTRGDRASVAGGFTQAHVEPSPEYVDAYVDSSGSAAPQLQHADATARAQALAIEGAEHQRAGRVADAENVYAAALGLDPHNADALHLLGVLRLRQGDLTGAMVSIRAAIAVAPCTDLFRRSLADAQVAAGLESDAVSQLLLCCGVAGAVHDGTNRSLVSPECRARIGTLWAGGSDHERAAEGVAELRAAAEALEPDNAAVLSDLGWALHNNADNLVGEGSVERSIEAEALEVLELSSQRAPGVGRTWFRLGHASVMAGRYADAIQQLETAAELSPTSAVYHNIGVARMMAAHPDPTALPAALEAWQRAVDLSHEDDCVDTLMLMGDAAVRMWDADLAATYYERAVMAQKKRVASGAVVPDTESHTLPSMSPAQLSLVRDVRVALGVPLVWQAAEDAYAWHQANEELLAGIVARLEAARGEAGPGAATIAEPVQLARMIGFERVFAGRDTRRAMELQARLMRAAAPATTFVAPHLASVCDVLAHMERSTRHSRDARIRVGFVSAFLRGHTVGKISHAIIAGLNRDRFHVTVVFVGPPAVTVAEARARAAEISMHRDAGAAGSGSRGIDFDSSELDITASIVGRADEVVIARHRYFAARDRLQQLALDVIVYPEVGMEHVTYLLSLGRLAPVQIAFWGHLSTTGATGSVDYFVSSRSFFPPHARAVTGVVTQLPDGAGVVDDCAASTDATRRTLCEAAVADIGATVQSVPEFTVLRHSDGAVRVPLCDPDDAARPYSFSERRLVCMQSIGAALSRPPAVTADERAHAARMLSAQGVSVDDTLTQARLYFVGQSSGKLSPQFDDVLARVMLTDPKATVMLVRGVASDHVFRRWNANPVLAESVNKRRLVVVNGTQSTRVFLAVASLAAVAIDTLPVGGGMTTIELLGIGVPVVTCPSCLSTYEFGAALIRFLDGHAGPSAVPSALASTLVVESPRALADAAVKIARDVRDAARVRADIEAVVDAMFAASHDDVHAEWEATLVGAVADRMRVAQLECKGEVAS